MVNQEFSNGDWKAYKMAVLQQLEKMDKDIEEVKTTLQRIDKEVATARVLSESASVASHTLLTNTRNARSLVVAIVAIIVSGVIGLISLLHAVIPH